MHQVSFYLGALYAVEVVKGLSEEKIEALREELLKRLVEALSLETDLVNSISDERMLLLSKLAAENL